MPNTPQARGRCYSLALLGEAPELAPHLAYLRVRQVPAEVYPTVDVRAFEAVRKLQRPLVVLGEILEPGTDVLTMLHELRVAGVTMLATVNADERVKSLSSSYLLPWPEVAWFAIEVFRQYDRTADARVQFALEALESVEDRHWLASALMFCPSKMGAAAASLALSRASLHRRMRRYGITWHQLCDRAVRRVYAYNAGKRDVKLQGVAEELGCNSVSELVRRVRRIEAARGD